MLFRVTFVPFVGTSFTFTLEALKPLKAMHRCFLNAGRIPKISSNTFFLWSFQFITFPQNKVLIKKKNKQKKLLQGLLRYPYFLSILYITEEKISEALLAIEKNDIKDIGVQPMGRCIELMAKIKEVIKTQEKGHQAEVKSKLEDSSQKRKITLDKKAWDLEK